MNEKRMSLARKLMIILSVIFVFLICFLSFTMYLLADEQLTSFDQQNIDQHKESFKSAISISQRGLELYDARYDAYLDSVLSVFSKMYNESHMRGTIPDLNQVHEKIPKFLNGTVYLYLISSEGIVIDTTYTSEIGLDFREYPEFYETLTAIRNGNSSMFDPWEESIADPNARIKYGYLPSSDHQYILEAGLECNSIEQERRNLFSFQKILDEEIKTGPDIISVYLYSSLGYVLNSASIRSDRSQSTPSSEVLHSLYEQVYNTKGDIIQNSQDNIRVHTFYIPYKDSDAVSEQYFDKIGIIIYDTENLNNNRFILLIIFLFITILVVLIFIIISLYISKRLILPIEKIIDDIEIIAQGHYDHRIQDTIPGRETKRLRRAINQMVTVIQKNLLDINQQKEQLDTELKRRRQVEDELTSANEKLHHLSNITRHDILNQLTALLGYIELAREETDITKIHGHLDATERIGMNIQDLIEFTRNYQNLGIQGWIWQDPEALIRETIQKICTGCTYRSDGLCDYLIYADPLFEKVIYNLIENSVRHGGPDMNTISLSVATQGSTLVLIYEDNGFGITDEDKEQVFERGYGKNSGLGLYMIREILSMTGITITENGSFGSGARFEIRVPDGAYKKGIVQKRSDDTTF